MNGKVVFRLGTHFDAITLNCAAYLCFGICIGDMGYNLPLGKYAANIPLGGGGQCSSDIWVLHTFLIVNYVKTKKI